MEKILMPELSVENGNKQIEPILGHAIINRTVPAAAFREEEELLCGG